MPGPITSTAAEPVTLGAPPTEPLPPLPLPLAEPDSEESTEGNSQTAALINQWQGLSLSDKLLITGGGAVVAGGVIALAVGNAPVLTVGSGIAATGAAVGFGLPALTIGGIELGVGASAAGAGIAGAGLLLKLSQDTPQAVLNANKSLEQAERDLADAQERYDKTYDDFVEDTGAVTDRDITQLQDAVLDAVDTVNDIKSGT